MSDGRAIDVTVPYTHSPRHVFPHSRRALREDRRVNRRTRGVVKLNAGVTEGSTH